MGSARVQRVKLLQIYHYKGELIDFSSTHLSGDFPLVEHRKGLHTIYATNPYLKVDN